MKLKILTLIICFTFSYVQFTSAAVAVKKKDDTSLLKSQTKDSQFKKSYKKRRWFQKKRKLKRWKFRGFNFLKWKKKERITQEKIEDTDTRKVDSFAMFSAIFAIAGSLLFFSPINPFGYVGIIFIILGAILGIKGLINIRRNPEEKKGKILAWTGIMVFILMLSFLVYLIYFAF